MTSEEIFIGNLLKIVTGELVQIERMLESMRIDEIQMAHLRGERVRLMQMKGLLEGRLVELTS